MRRRSAQLRHGDEGSRLPQVHGSTYAVSALLAREYMYWTSCNVRTNASLVKVRAAPEAPNCESEDVMKHSGLILLTRLRLRPTSCMGIRGGVCGLRSSLQGLPWL